MDLSTTVLGQRNHAAGAAGPRGQPQRSPSRCRVWPLPGRPARWATVMVVSSGASRTWEDVAQAASGPLWLQQYIYKDPGLTLESAARAEEAGYSAICLTVDAKVQPKRERNIRNDYVGGPTPNYAHLNRPRPTWKLGSDAQTRNTDLRSQAASWPDLEWLAANTRLPVVVKGVLAGEDGKRCADSRGQGSDRFQPRGTLPGHRPGDDRSPARRGGVGRRAHRGLPGRGNPAGNGHLQGPGPGRPGRAHWAALSSGDWRSTARRA